MSLFVDLNNVCKQAKSYPQSPHFLWITFFTICVFKSTISKTNNIFQNKLTKNVNFINFNTIYRQEGCFSHFPQLVLCFDSLLSLVQFLYKHA